MSEGSNGFCVLRLDFKKTGRFECLFSRHDRMVFLDKIINDSWMHKRRGIDTLDRRCFEELKAKMK